MSKSLSKRLKTTKTGKVLRRAKALGHNRGNKRRVQIMRKKRYRGVDVKKKSLKRLK